MDDLRVVGAQLDRPPRSPVEVLGRCHLGLPVVIDVPPFLDDGTPFPTSYWLTCPLAVKRIGRIEADGGVRQAEAMLDRDAALAAGQEAAAERYAANRDGHIAQDHTGPRPTGGVGGSMGGVKCLHAHYADHAAGNDNPIGAWVAPGVEPLNCTERCVVDAERNPAWTEPDR